MVLEQTIHTRDVEKVITKTFGNSNISLVIANNTIVLTPVAANKSVSELTMLSESALANDWLLPEEDKTWEFL